jgi:hypothetical protein
MNGLKIIAVTLAFNEATAWVGPARSSWAKVLDGRDDQFPTASNAEEVSER